MKTKLVTTLLLLLVVSQSYGRDDILNLPFAEAVNKAVAEDVIDGQVTFYLAGNSHPKVDTDFGEFQSNKKTNGVGKSDTAACQWALFSALKSLQKRAKSLGANAVINIKSNYKNNSHSHPTNYQCGAGALMAGVTLIGDVVKLK